MKKTIEVMADSLGSRIKFLKERLESLCYQRRLLNKSQKTSITLCCDKTNMPTQWGCNFPQIKRRRRSSYKRIKKYKKIKKEKLKPKRKYFKRKNKNKEKRMKTNPKSRCECWNCGEIGHLSYDYNKKKVKVLSKDYEDLESELSEVNLDQISSEEFDIFEVYSNFSSEEDYNV